MKKLIFLLLLSLPATGFSQRVLYGSHVLIDKPVNEDLYVAGGTVTINAPVYGDLSVAAGTIQISRPAVVEGNLLTGGGEVILDGTVKGMVRAGSRMLKINGIVEGPLDARAVELNLSGTIKGNTIISAQKLYISPHAALLKGVRYWNGNGAADFGAAVKNGQPVFDASLKMDQPRWHYLGFASFLVLIWYLATALLFIILIQYFFGKAMQKAAECTGDFHCPEVYIPCARAWLADQPAGDLPDIWFAAAKHTLAAPGRS